MITKFRIRAFAVDGPGDQVTFRVADISLPDPNNDDTPSRSAAGTGPTVTIVPDEDSSKRRSPRSPGACRSAKGQHLAVDTNESIGIIYNSNGNDYSYVFAPPLVEGAGPRGSTEGINELLVAATIEPDADGDGFGDETQDRCPAQATTQGACDDTKPGVNDFSVANGELTYTLARGGDGDTPAREKAARPQAGQEMRQTDAEKQSEKTLHPVQARSAPHSPAPAKSAATRSHAAEREEARSPASTG